MGQHPPEAPQGFGRYSGAQSRDVPLQKGACKRLHPTGPFRRRPRQPGSRKATAHPKTILMLPAHFGKREATHVNEDNSSLPESRKSPGSSPRKRCPTAERRPFGPGRQIGRRISNSSGMRCTSSRTTRPLALAEQSPRGVADSACLTAPRDPGPSMVPDHSDAACRARVVLPTCLAPSKATTGTWDSPLTIVGKQIGTGNILLHITLSTIG